MNFFKSFLAALLAIFVSGFLLFLLIIGIIGAAASSGESKVTVKDNSILKISLKDQIVENKPIKSDDFDFDFSEFSPFAPSQAKMGLHQIAEAIRKAKDDDKIRGIYFTPGMGVQTGFSGIRTIHEALKEFKESGKFIYSYSEIYSEKPLYLAALSDKVYMPPTGFIEFNGLASTPMYYKGLFDKLDIEPEIFKVGTYKSAVEPYFRTDMSEANREQVTKYLDALWGEYRKDLAESRGMSEDKLDGIAEDLVLGDGRDAMKYGLIDEIAYEEDILNKLKEVTDTEEDKKLNFISLKKYMKAPSSGNTARDRIAVVFAEGQIVSGKSEDGMMGSETIVKALRAAREDKKVKAVVLRVNSPGGSALASDMITKEVALTKKVKPIICSMGDVAASGGYYIAAKCDKIFADKNTITGSIGVFGLALNTEDMFRNKLGLTFDQVETHEHANFGNPNFPITPAERAMRQGLTNRVYSDFLKVVYTGRPQFFADSTAVDKIGQGRVWAGTDAKGINLIDEFGNLYDAIDAAVAAADLEEDYRLKLLPRTKSPMEEILKSMGQAYMSEMNPLHQEMSELKKIERMMPRNGVFMLMDFDYGVE